MLGLGSQQFTVRPLIVRSNVFISNTCAFGINWCYVVSITSQKENVNGFNRSLPSVPNVKIGCAVLPYNCPLDLVTYVLVFEQELLVPKFDVKLLCVDQIHGYKPELNATRELNDDDALFYMQLIGILQ